MIGKLADELLGAHGGGGRISVEEIDAGEAEPGLDLAGLDGAGTLESLLRFIKREGVDAGLGEEEKQRHVFRRRGKRGAEGIEIRVRHDLKRGRGLGGRQTAARSEIAGEPIFISILRFAGHAPQAHKA